MRKDGSDAEKMFLTVPDSTRPRHKDQHVVPQIRSSRSTITVDLTVDDETPATEEKHCSKLKGKRHASSAPSLASKSTPDFVDLTAELLPSSRPSPEPKRRKISPNKRPRLQVLPTMTRSAGILDLTVPHPEFTRPFPPEIFLTILDYLPPSDLKNVAWAATQGSYRWVHERLRDGYNSKSKMWIISRNIGRNEVARRVKQLEDGNLVAYKTREGKGYAEWVYRPRPTLLLPGMEENEERKGLVKSVVIDY